MSKTIVLEISDEVYSSVQKKVKQRGSSTETFVLESIVKNLSEGNNRKNSRSREGALENLMRFAGAVNSGDANSADNDQIDTDLASEYSRNSQKEK
jgi:hypothetical protein